LKSGVTSSKGATVKGKTKKKTGAADATLTTMPSIKESNKDMGTTNMISDMSATFQSGEEKAVLA
jgi:hypothetical protein